MNNNPYPGLTYIPYDRSRAVAYARRWALSRNPLFSDYTGIGGDCSFPFGTCKIIGIK